MNFKDTCEYVETYLEKEWRELDEFHKIAKLEKEKRAIMGYEEEIEEYKKKITEILDMGEFSDVKVPPWYQSLADGVFAELYGLAGLHPWVYDETEKYKNSSSAKLIGDRLYCLIEGHSVLQPQSISRERREQLKRAFLLGSPRERLETGFHEVYLRNGIRITIYSGERTKEGEDIMVFRKYLMKDYSFEKMVELGTIPSNATELFKTMVAIGFNVMFSGPVRSGKTTFLQTWQKYENPGLEGLAIATDSETPWHKVMKDVPIMQLVADGKELETITKSILRGDNDYVLLEEMRDGIAFNIALEIMSTGTRRCKSTVHSDDPVNLPFTMAMKIKSKYGGNLEGLIQQIVTNFHYIFQFCQMEGKRNEKKLKGIWEYSFDSATNQVIVQEVMRYDFVSERWLWSSHLGEDKKKIGEKYGKEIIKMERLLEELSRRNPIRERKIIYPRYYLPEKIEKGTCE